ncbi:MAG TPA: alpha/beta hydrolase [Halobacteriales archaeon]|nr:alpha/beta hydrolase [Halobacteriales archaeon]
MKASEPHPQVQSILDLIEEADVLPLCQYPAEEAREVAEGMRADAEGPSLAAVTDRTVSGPDGDVPVRVYRPGDDGPYPATVYFHGGGWVIGGLDSHDLLCRHLAQEANSVVVSVDYRLAPEHPFPAAVEDTYAATEWVAANPDEVGADGRLAVAGDSAGGNLAAVVALVARDRDGPDIDHQGLIYPAVSPHDDWPSRAENAEGYFLSVADMEWFYDCYLGSEVHARNPYAFPLAACDLAGLPPATVHTAGFDPLRDEGAAYAQALEDAGVGVTHRNYDDVIHGFATMLAEPARVDRSHEALADLAGDLRDAFGS